MNKKVIILRGVSGSGKSTFAEHLSFLINCIADACSKPDCVICTADDYFIQDGEYKFDGTKLGFAHKQCQDKFENALKNGANYVICANTNTKSTDFKFYIDKAGEYGYDVTSLVVENRHGNKDVHGLNEETLKRQEEAIKSNLKLR